MENDILQFVIDLGVAAIPIVIAFGIKEFAKIADKYTALKNLPSVVKSAVIALQQAGVTEYIEGEVKKSKVYEQVTEYLKKHNISFSETEINNKIQEGFTDAKKDGSLDLYPQLTKEQADAQANAAKLAAAQKQLADAQATVAKLSTTAAAPAQTTTPAK